MSYSTTRMHQPVMLAEMLHYLAPQEHKIYVDCTFGRGGYSRALLNAINCEVIGLDQDLAVSQYADELKQEFGNRFQFINENFSSITKVLKELEIPKVDGIIIDLGVSLMQLTDPNRGFSFTGDAYLDMRMNQTQGEPAAVLINKATEQELADIIYYYGGEHSARLIARTIVQARKQKPINSTAKLTEVICQAIGPQRAKIHPATRTFQAIRIAVNRELEHLQLILEQVSELLADQGKLIIVSFHSAEDRIVKQYLTKYKLDKKQNSGVYQLLSKKPVVPSYIEIKKNPAARSAKMRAAMKLEKL